MAYMNDSNSNGSRNGVVTSTTPLKQEKQAKSTYYDPEQAGNNDSGDSSTPGREANALQASNYNKGLLFRLVLATAATSATLGYDVGIMAAAIQPLQAEMDLNGVQKEFAMGSLNFFAAFGALLGGKIADKSGRRETVKWCGWLFVVGTILMAFALDYAMLVLGRIVTGLGVGVAFVVAPIFITEVAPPEKRGELNTLFDVAINAGILAGYVTGFLVQLVSPGDWRLMLGCGVILPVIVLVFLSTLPESPRWHMLVGQKPAAIEVLQRLGSPEDEAQQVAQDMEDEVEATKQQSNVRWGPRHKLAVGFGIFQQISGPEAVLYYSADFLARAGLVSPTLRLLGNCFVGLCKLVPEWLAMRYVDTLGRRPLMMGSGVALVLSMASLSFSFYIEAPAKVVVVLLCCVMASFSIGLGPFTFLCASENLNVSERATGMTYCAATNRCTSGLVALTAVSLYERFGYTTLFGIYALTGLASLVFYIYVPETAGKKLEDLHRSN